MCSCGFLYVFLAIVKCVENIAHWSCALFLPAFLSFSQIINHFFIYVHTHICTHTYLRVRVCAILVAQSSTISLKIKQGPTQAEQN